MREHGYSKLPVVEAGRAIGLLTTAALARWLGAEADTGLVDLEATAVASVMKHAVDGDIYRIVGTSLPLGEAISFFLDRQESGRRLEAILITTNGRPDGRIVGLMTSSDLPTALRTLYPEGEPSPSS
jgi:CBS domain-containing protein